MGSSSPTFQKLEGVDELVSPAVLTEVRAPLSDSLAVYRPAASPHPMRHLFAPPPDVDGPPLSFGR